MDLGLNLYQFWEVFSFKMAIKVEKGDIVRMSVSCVQHTDLEAAPKGPEASNIDQSWIQSFLIDL